MLRQEPCTVELREQLVLAVLAGEASVAALCRRAGVSRKTAYKWLERYRETGRAGLIDRSRARHTQEHRVNELARVMILETRTRHSTWGVKKILPHLESRYPWLDLPCQSTAGEILKRAGLSRPQKRRHRQQGAIGEGAAAGAPNHTWTTDFKGEFRLGNGVLCYPLTIADAFSRYLLCIDGRPGTHTEGARRSFRRVFDEYGLPERIRSDNGVPFAGGGLARLSQLSVWFMQLGITIEHITPGRPCENGSHERMHRTLKAQTTLFPLLSRHFESLLLPQPEDPFAVYEHPVLRSSSQIRRVHVRAGGRRVGAEHAAAHRDDHAGRQEAPLQLPRHKQQPRR